MATAFRESIETFMSITGSSELVARQKLSENGGNLNEAVNSYYIEGDANTIIHETDVPAPQEDFMEIDETSEMANHRSTFSPARDSRNLFPTLGPDLNSSESHHPETASRIDDVTNTLLENDPEIRDDFNIAYDKYPSFESSYPQILSEQNEHASGVIPSHDTRVTPSAPAISNLPDYGIEEEMIRAAIEASKREAEIVQQNDAVPHQGQSQLVDPQLDHMVSLSLTSAEPNNFLHELGYATGSSETRTSKVPKIEKVGTSESSNGRLGGGSSSFQDETQDVDEQPLVRHGNRCMNLSSSSSGPAQHQNVNNLVDSENHIPSDEWVGISSQEHEEAVMLEAALFGGVPEGAGYRVPYARRRYTRSGLGRTVGPGSGPYTRSTPRPPSPSLTAQRLIREQQDDEYLASLQADREKELLEQAAREAAREEERLKEEAAQRRLEQEQEMERQLAAKEASLPQEPSCDDKNAVNLLVRMPDGSRRGRRFLRTDKLQHLFDFIDVGRVFKPSTYRLVRPYPRRAFSNEESELSLNELGLTSKQEALFLELI